MRTRLPSTTGHGFWFGGLVYLLSGLRELKPLEDKVRTRLTSLVAGRFSNMALVSVLLIGVTGLYSAWLRVGTKPALTSKLSNRSFIILMNTKVIQR